MSDSERGGSERRECFHRHDWCPGPDAPDKNGEAFGGKCSTCAIDPRKDVERRLSEPIMEVWGQYDDFDTMDYVAFVLDENARELRDAENFGEAKGELADTAICAIRMLAEMGFHPEATILERLSDRMEGNQEDIIQTYKERYQRQLHTDNDQ